MRRILVLLMVVLLPLRGWAGDLMSFQMGMKAADSSQVHVMPPGCPMHAQAEVDATDSGDFSMPAGIEKCSACQLCIPLATLLDPRVDVLTHAGHAKPMMSGFAFVSAPPGLAFKPPIS